MERLYHYTKKEARDGICDNHELWFKLTSAESRNDTRDTVYIREVLSKAISTYKGDDHFFLQALKVMNSVLNPVAPEDKNCYIEKNIFMFCAMNLKNDEAGKDLYKDENVEVYCIEFDKRILINYLNDLLLIRNNGLLLHGNMIYDESEQLNKIYSIIAKFEKIYWEFNHNKGVKPLFMQSTMLASTPCNDYSGISGCQPALNENLEWYLKTWDDMEDSEKFNLDKLWKSLANEFYKLSTFIKDPEYEHEKEYRIAFCGEEHFKKSITINSRFCIQFPIDKSIILTNVYIP
ncbi:MAG: hypothetical protein CVU89_17515 [Firmicutes bacterium HGW-Firmicutes-14]|nr:MAG: hypothetical protein CVU89_17515 [Firmicutes bacterium HGW-Firmicutes-14]